MASTKTMRYFEDYALGQTVKIDGPTLTEPEIIKFAKKYDPQPYHVDAAAAEDSKHGELVASGFHPPMLAVQMLVDEHFKNVQLASGSGLDELRWQMPVYPGDTLSVCAEVIEARIPDESSDYGILRENIKVLNQNGEVVLSFIPNLHIECR